MDVLIEELEQSMWVAALKEGRLDGFEVDPIDEEVRWGSIYWARVIRVDKGLDAVFLSLDGDNQGILFNQDTRQPAKKNKQGKTAKGGEEAIGKAFKPGQMVAVQAKTAYTPSADNADEAAEHKLAKMSMDITLPGRHLIHCPMESQNLISVRIRDKKLRKQLLNMLESLEDINGCILRASAANTQTDILVREGLILKEVWEQIQPFLEGEEPGLIMLGPDAIQRTLSDHAAQVIDTIEVTTMDHYTHIEEWCSIFAPDLVTKIVPIELDNAADDLALFDHRDIMGQIEDLFQLYAILPGGGNIIIEETAALTAIDVNKGADDNSRLATNIEAAAELARQIRLRNTGGIILVDFLKLKSKKEEGKLIAALEEAINEDPCTVQIHGLTALGLMELTRARRTPPLQARFESVVE